jgi:hypothetical protein
MADKVSAVERLLAQDGDGNAGTGKEEARVA